MGFRDRFENSYEKLNFLQRKTTNLTLAIGNEALTAGVVSRVKAS